MGHQNTCEARATASLPWNVSACDLTLRAGWAGRRRGRRVWRVGWTGQAAFAVVGGFLRGFLIAGYRAAGPEQRPLGRPGECPAGFGVAAGEHSAHNSRG